MNSVPTQPAGYQPSFFSPSSAASLNLNSSPPTSWNSGPRPRLKRAHSSGQPPAPPNNSPSGPLSPALYSAIGPIVSPHHSETNALRATSDSSTSTVLPSSSASAIALSRSRNGSLEIIQELPQAENLATSPRPPSALTSSLRFEAQTAPSGGSSGYTDDDRPNKSKRRRVAPDHEAFGRLSLNYSPIPSNSGAGTFPFLPTSPTSLHASVPGAFLSSPLTSPVQPSFPSVPPTSPDFLPSHSPPRSSAHHGQNCSISPPDFSPLYSPYPSAETTLATPGPVTSSFDSSAAPPAPFPRGGEPHAIATDEHEIEMNSQSSWDLGPHRIYVASLSEDEDEDGDGQGSKKVGGHYHSDEREQAEAKAEVERQRAEQFRINSIVANGLSPGVTPNWLLERRKKEAGALIVYQPPPTLSGLGDPTEMYKNETRVERIRRQEAERQREEEFQEFRRESERIEADHDGVKGSRGDLADMEGQDEMQMEMEMEP